MNNHQQYKIKLVDDFGKVSSYHIVERNVLRATKTAVKIARDKTRYDNVDWNVTCIERVGRG